MISIITPVYNGESYIEDCLKTVIEQQCPCIEHIILDGGSQDGTVDVLKRYSEQYPHIRWISEKDKGQSDAMNKGIAMAKGDVIAILNVDDYYEKNTLNRVADLFKELPEPSLLVGNCNIWDHDGRLKVVNKPSKLKLTELLLGYQVNPHPVNPSAYFYHKSIHQKIGSYLVDEHYVMDLHFIFSAVQVANVKYVDELWGNYRDLEGTKTHSDRLKGIGVKRQQELYAAYTQKLSLKDQWLLKLQKTYYASRFYKKLRRLQVKTHQTIDQIKDKFSQVKNIFFPRYNSISLNKLDQYNDQIKSEEKEISHRALEVANHIRELERQPAIFIHGTMQRSGTVYTGEILGLHPDLHAYPNEIWEVPFLKFADKLSDFEHEFLTVYPQNKSKIGKHDFLPLFGSSFIRYLHSYLPEGQRMLLKVPNVYYLNYFFTVFPYENLLLLLRDGRDVVNSTIKTWPNSNFEDVCKRWEHNTETILKFVDYQTERADQIFLARYEHIVQNPETFARDLCNHFNLDSEKFPFGKIENLPVRGSSSLKTGEEVTWNPTPKAVSFKTTGKWNDWSTQMKDTFKRIAGQALIDAGYTSDCNW